MPIFIHPYIHRNRHTDAHTHARAQEMLARTRECSCHLWFPSERCTPQQIPSICLLFDSEQKTNTKKTTTGPLLDSDRVPPTYGGQTNDFCTFVNQMEMHACADAYAHAHMHTYRFTPTSTHEMRTRTHVHRHCLRPYANAIAVSIQTLGRCLAELENGRRGPKAASSNFEHKPWKPQDGVKVSKVLYF